MYGDHLPDWFMAQDDRLRRRQIARNVLVLGLSSVLTVLATAAFETLARGGLDALLGSSVLDRLG